MKKIFTLLFLFAFGLSYGQTLTEVYVPQYIQGVTVSNVNRIPYAYRVTLSGLTPSATYRYFNSVVTPIELPTSNGAGNIIYPHDTAFSMGSQSLATAGAYNEFTTDASGSYTGWFITEPTANATRFIPGTSVQLRIILNDGMDGTLATTRLTTTSTVTVINFGSTPIDGTGITSTPGSASPKNFVMLYDNEAGTGRPIAGVYVENDGLKAGASYASFYKTNVDSMDGAWGTIIPNMLPNGIKRIAQYDFASGNLVGATTSATGQYPLAGSPGSTISTTNPAGGNTEIITIDGSAISLPLSLVTFKASLTDKTVKLNWTSANELGIKDFSVERSQDGRNYTSIGKVAALNNNAAAYTYSDASPLQGANYYRLKMTGKDGAAKYSSVAVINTRLGIAAHVFPNPASASITVSHSKANTEATLAIVNALGQQIKMYNVQAGATQTSLSIKELGSGTYMLIYQNGSDRSVTRFVK